MVVGREEWLSFHAILYHFGLKRGERDVAHPAASALGGPQSAYTTLWKGISCLHYLLSDPRTLALEVARAQPSGQFPNFHGPKPMKTPRSLSVQGVADA
jgi:hypothetical protein